MTTNAFTQTEFLQIPCRLQATIMTCVTMHTFCNCINRHYTMIQIRTISSVCDLLLNVMASMLLRYNVKVLGTKEEHVFGLSRL